MHQLVKVSQREPLKIHLPLRNAVAAILDQEGLDQALSIRSDAGIDSTSVEVLAGQEGAEILDLDGSHHGLRARLVRHIQLPGSSENDLRNYSADLRTMSPRCPAGPG